MTDIRLRPKKTVTYDFDYEVNERGRVVEVMSVHGTGSVCSESMVYGLDTDDPYTKKHGTMYYLSDEAARKAREARDAYRAWKSGRATDPAWGWEVR